MSPFTEVRFHRREPLKALQAVENREIDIDQVNDIIALLLSIQSSGAPD